jgi:hypothetical protein
MSESIKDVRTHRSSDGSIWHCAKDVYKSLGITWSGATLGNTAASCKAMFPVDTPKGERLAVFIDQSEVEYLRRKKWK